MIEEQVEVEILVADFHVDLPPDEGKANAEFEQELFDVRHEGVLDGPLVGVVAQVEEIEEIRGFGELLGEVGLRRRQGGLKVCDRLALAGMQARFDLERQYVARPAMLQI